LYDNHLAELKA
jgi:hypothetical protein